MCVCSYVCRNKKYKKNLRQFLKHVKSIQCVYPTTAFLRNPLQKNNNNKPYPTIRWQAWLTGRHGGPDPNRKEKDIEAEKLRYNR